MNSLKERIATDFKRAMLARDAFVVETLSGLKAVILNEEVARGVRGTGLSDEQIEQLLAREAKKRDEAAELYEKGDRPESATKERAEKQLIAQYLPAQLDETAVRALVNAAVAALQPAGLKDMGRVIGAVKAQAGNSADGAVIARLVKAALSS